jgi:uncharacterized delta-60 repeat protein
MTANFGLQSPDSVSNRLHNLGCEQKGISMKRHSSRLVLLALIFLALTLASIPNAIVQAASGDLDPSFGNGGKVTTRFASTFTAAKAVAVQSDGKIVVAGFETNPLTDLDILLVRYNPDGSLDSTFGTGGRVITDFLGRYEQANALVIQRDGKIIAGGFTSFTSNEFALVRYNPDGSLDSTFGEGGKVATDFFGNDDTVAALAIQTDGKIVAVGRAYHIRIGSDFAIARYNPDGSPDSTFGSGGKVTISFAGGFANGEAHAVAIQKDGKLVVAGTASPTEGTLDDFVVARLNPGGSLDSSFGSGGVQTWDYLHRVESCSSLAIQNDGKIVLVGLTFGGFSDLDVVLLRYNTNGSLDPSFGSGGQVISDLSGREDTAAAVVLQKNGKIIVGGDTFNTATNSFDFLVARYKTDGGLDETFGAGGKNTAHFSNASLNAIALQSDGKIVAAGQAIEIALARFLGDDPGLDLCLQDDSNSNLLQINTTTGEYQFTNCAGLTVGGTGTLTKRGSAITLQHNTADRRVMATIDTASGKATASLQLFAQGRTFSITDRNITNNTCACR